MLSDSSEDRDTEEALKEFDFLVTSDEGDGESRSSGDGTDWGKEILTDCTGKKRGLSIHITILPGFCPKQSYSNFLEGRLRLFKKLILLLPFYTQLLCRGS